MSNPVVPELVLGTVQVGIPYGRRRHLGLCGEAEAFRIFDTAWNFGIRAFDTAVRYGESAGRLSRWLHGNKLLKEARVCTKIPCSDMANARKILEGVAPFEGVAHLVVMSHGQPNPNWWPQFVELGQLHHFECGQSVYTSDEVLACKELAVCRIQAPGNVLDLEQIQRAREIGLPLDVRSVFLQGMLLVEPEVAEAKVPGLGPITSYVRDFSRTHQISTVSLLISGVLRAKRSQDRLVIGADKAEEIPEWVASTRVPEAISNQFLNGLRERFGEAVPLEIRDPRLWK